VDLRRAWVESAPSFLEWARSQDEGTGWWQLNLGTALALLPPPGRLTVDIGCGEGRLGRQLTRLGHHVVGCDVSDVLLRAALGHDEPQTVLVADAASVPLRSGCADLVVMSMVLMDIEDLRGAVAEAARVLCDGGRFYFSVLHPMHTSGAFSVRGDVDAPYSLVRPYFVEARHPAYLWRRDGTAMSFERVHRPLQAYFCALERAGFAVTSLREPQMTPERAGGNPNTERWSRVPNSLHVLSVLHDFGTAHAIADK
jgi:SAM-dependent methyltransferase